MAHIAYNIICNIYLTRKLLQTKEIALPLYPVISFSVINYVVSMRRPHENGGVSFFYSSLRRSVKKNCSPPHSRLIAFIDPPWNATAFFTMDNPRPEPPSSLVLPSDTR